MLRPTCAASSVTVSRPSFWSAARIFLSSASMGLILPQQWPDGAIVRNIFGAIRNSFLLSGTFRGELSMAASSVVAFWAVALLLIIVPGADWAFVLSAGLRGRTVLPAVGGIVLGYAGVTVVVAAGVGALVARSPAFLTGLTIAGGLYLAWQGTKALARPSAPGGPADAPGGASRGMLARGIGVSALNPKGLLMFLALL